MLIKCPECGDDVSSSAPFCPHCGLVLKTAPVAVSIPLTTPPPTASPPKPAPKKKAIFQFIALFLVIVAFFTYTQFLWPSALMILMAIISIVISEPRRFVSLACILLGIYFITLSISPYTNPHGKKKIAKENQSFSFFSKEEVVPKIREESNKSTLDELSRMEVIGKIKLKEFKAIGSKSVLSINGKINNANDFPVKDIKIRCMTYGENGNLLHVSEKILYELVEARASYRFKDLVMGSVSSEMKRTDCKIIAVEQ